MAQLQSTGITGSLTVPGAGNKIASNTAVGRSSLALNTAGTQMSAFGVLALRNNATGVECNAFGYKALYNSTTNYNSAFGDFACASNTTGERNCAVGTQANRDNQVGSHNCAFGVNALLSNLSSFNCAFGSEALRSNVNGARNCAFGYKALNQCTSNGNTAIGFGAGINITTGTNITCIGSGSRGSTATAANEVVLGNAAITALRCQVSNLTGLSDARDKAFIESIKDGLYVIDRVRPVKYRWDKREWYPNGVRDGSKSDTNIQVGFIAQELLEMMRENNVNYLKLVNESNPDQLEATPGNLFSHLVSAVQELHQKVKALEDIVYNK